jgi:hypothetical protein
MKPSTSSSKGDGFNTKGKVALAIAGILLLIFMVAASRVEWIPAGHIGVMYNAASGLERKVIKPSALVVWPFQQLYTYPTRVQAAIYSQDPTLGERKTADGVQITTNDNANTTYDITVLYRVKADDVFTVFQKFGPIPIEDIQTLHIRRAVKEGASAVGNRYDVYDLMGPKREEASEALTRELRARLAPKGVTIIMAMITRPYPNPDIAAKITNRVNGYTQLEISKLEAQIAEVNRKQGITIGQAQNQARSLTALQTQDKSVEMLRLENEAAAIAKWKAAGGRLPSIIVKPGQSVIVNGSGAPVVPGGAR